MPRVKQYHSESEDSEDSVDYVHEPEPVSAEEEIDIEVELKKARQSFKNKKLAKEEENLAKQIKRERLAKQKEYPPQHKASGRYEKNTDAAKEWGQKMQEAKRKKKLEREQENKKQVEREELTMSKLEEAQEAKIKALQKKIEQFEAQASQPVAPRLTQAKPKSARRTRKVVVETPDNTEDDTEVEEVKKIVRKKREKKAVASQHIESEKTRIENELYLQQMRSVIPNFGM